MVHRGSKPHQGQPVKRAGASLDNATAAVVMLHGRGAQAESMLALADELGHDDVTFLAPQAAGNTWYPNSFLAPLEQNEPGLSSGLDAISETLDELETASIPVERTILLGFSQGACLASEYVARHARRYGGLAALSGGVIGPDGTPRDYEGSLDGTPVFLGCSDRDPHIPLERVHETADVFRDLDGDVTEEIYEGMGHTIIDDEVEAVRELVSGAASNE